MKILVLLTLSIQFCFAKTGLEVMQMIDNSNKGFKTEKSKFLMILKNAHGESAKREMEIKTIEKPEDLNFSVIEFNQPKDVKGTKLLTHQQKDEDNLQWLYLPKLVRVKQIQSSQQSGPFMGSEFSYEDIAGQQLDKYSYELISETKVGDDIHYKVKQTPKKSSGYSYQIATISNKFQNAFNVEYFDIKKELLKTLKINLTDFKKYNSNKKEFFRASKVEMVNHQNRKSSELIEVERSFGASIPDSAFLSSNLKR